MSTGEIVEVISDNEVAELEKAENEGRVDIYTIVREHISPYTVEERINAVMCYITSRNMKEAAKTANVPYETLKWWKYRCSWWDPVITELRRRKQDELDGALTGLIHDTIGKIADRVNDGDTKYDTKTGSLYQVPMTGKELATVAGILFDKRAAMRGDPTSITRPQTSADHIKELESRFKDFTAKLENAGAVAKPINGEVVKD